MNSKMEKNQIDHFIMKALKALQIDNLGYIQWQVSATTYVFQFNFNLIFVISH